MNLNKGLLWLALLAIIGVAGVGAWMKTQPDTFVIKREIMIKSRPDHIFAMLDEFDKWSRWCPWAHKDPTMRSKISGKPNGPGAIYEWSGDRSVGAGKMTILSANPPRQLILKLEIKEPMQTDNEVEFNLQETSPSETKVGWTMKGNLNWKGKLTGLFWDMEKEVGKDFEKGLADLKKVVEKQRQYPRLYQNKI